GPRRPSHHGSLAPFGPDADHGSGPRTPPDARGPALTTSPRTPDRPRVRGSTPTRADLSRPALAAAPQLMRPLPPRLSFPRPRLSSPRPRLPRPSSSPASPVPRARLALESVSVT